LQANDRILAHTIVQSDLSGSFRGDLSIPGGVPSGQYTIHALSLSDGNTIIGSHEVYLGLPLLELLISTRIWWIVTMMLIFVLVVSRTRYAFVPRPRDVNWRWPSYPRPVASSWQVQPGQLADSKVVTRQYKWRRRRRRWIGERDPSSVPIMVRSDAGD
jgi:hypothetical protein